MFTLTVLTLGLPLPGAIPIGGISITVPTVTAAGIGEITIGADLITDGIRGGIILTTDGTHGAGIHPTTDIVIIGDIPTATTTIPITTIGDGDGTTAQTGVSLTRTTTGGEAIRAVVRASHLRYAPITRPEYRVAARMLQHPHEAFA